MALLTKSKYLAGLQCHKLLWVLINDKDSIPATSEDAQKKMDAGTEIGILATKLFPEGIKIPTDDFKANLDITKENLSKNKILFEAGIMKNNCFSRLDILKPNIDGSFDIIEVKSSTQVKDENIQDVSFQKQCCEMAGLKISKCSLCFINNEYVRQGELDINQLFKIEDITEQVIEAQIDIQERIDELFKVINGQIPPISIGPQCSSPYECNLMASCWSFLPKNNVFDLYRGGKKSLELFNKNIHSIKDIPYDFKLTNNQEIQRKCEQTGEIHIQPTEIKQFLDTLQYPLFFLDFETYAPVIPKFDDSRPYQRMPFQFSLHIEQENGPIEHISFLAEGTDDPRPKCLAKLKETLGTQGSIVVYNEAFEKSVLKELAKDFPEYDEWVNEILPRVVDLLIPFRNFNYYNSKQQGSASIKKVLPALTEESYEGMEIGNGGDASSRYEEVTFGNVSEEERTKVREALLEYCKLDTWAEVKILEKLKELTDGNNR